MKQSKRGWKYLLFVALFLFVSPVWGVLNNGFDTEYLYLSHFGCDEGEGGLYVMNRYTGEQVAILQPAGSMWSTLTFSGTGTNDARLFAAKERVPVSPDAIEYNDDVSLIELDAQGNVVKEIFLSAILGITPGNPPLINPAVGTLRYSSYHDCLFIGINPDREHTGPGNNAMAYAIDLGLSTIIATYTGPNICKAFIDKNWGGGYSGPMVDINTRNGTLYMSSYNLGEEGDTGLGDLVAFDTSGGSTNIYTTLIDGVTASLSSGWANPVCPVYRGFIPDGRESIVVTQSGDTSWHQQREYYLDEVDGDGNLVERVHPEELEWWIERRPFRAQLEEDTGIILAPSLNEDKNLYDRAGVWYLNPDDTVTKFTEGDNWTQSEGIHDVDSPGSRPQCRAMVWPASLQTAIQHHGETSPTPDQLDYVVTNTGMNDSFSYTVIEDPEVSWISLNKISSGPISVNTFDTVTATFDTTGLGPGVYNTELVFTDDCSTVGVYRRPIQLHVNECVWDISPESTQSYKVTGDLTVWGNCQQPEDYIFTVSNIAGLDIYYTVEEVDSGDPATAVPYDYSWLALDKTSGGPVPEGTSDLVTVTITSDNTSKEAYLRFTPSCGTQGQGASTVIRKIEVTTLTATGNEKGFKHLYAGDVNPLDVNSCGEGCTFVIHTDIGGNNQAIGTVVTDLDADNGKAFNILQNSGTDPAGRYGYRSYTTDPLGNVRNYVNARLGFTMVARLKVQYNFQVAGLIWAWSKARSASTGYETPKAGYNIGWGGLGPAHKAKIREYQILTIPIEDRTSEALAFGDEQGAYHIIRLVNGFGIYGNRTLKVYFDEDPTPVLSFEGTDPTDTGTSNDSFCFGTFGASAIADAWWDWISFTNMGMYAPGEEDTCIGSLIPDFPPPCNDPFADVDGDGDVDQDDFAQFQLCYTAGGGGVPDGCTCLNTDGDGDIDSIDYMAFENCASGPAVAANPACDDPAP